MEEHLIQLLSYLWPDAVSLLNQNECIKSEIKSKNYFGYQMHTKMEAKQGEQKLQIKLDKFLEKIESPNKMRRASDSVPRMNKNFIEKNMQMPVRKSVSISSKETSERAQANESPTPNITAVPQLKSFRNVKGIYKNEAKRMRSIINNLREMIKK